MMLCMLPKFQMMLLWSRKVKPIKLKKKMRRPGLIAIWLKLTRTQSWWKMIRRKMRISKIKLGATQIMMPFMLVWMTMLNKREIWRMRLLKQLTCLKKLKMSQMMSRQGMMKMKRRSNLDGKSIMTRFTHMKMKLLRKWMRRENPRRRPPVSP